MSVIDHVYQELRQEVMKPRVVIPAEELAVWPVKYIKRSAVDVVNVRKGSG